MSDYELFSKRLERASRAGEPDVYLYDALPEHFRVQAVHIWRRAVPSFTFPNGEHYSEFWSFAENAIAEEHGVLKLWKGNDPQSNLENYFIHHREVLHAIDVLEFVFHEIERGICRRIDGAVQHTPDEAVGALNRRFQEHAIGYRFTSGQLVRVDSEYVHAEAVKPALSLVGDPVFSSAEEEFLKAHRCYREGDFETAITESNKAFESAMKVICKQRNLSHPKGKETAGALIDVLINQAGLVPKYLEQAMLAISEIRNNEGAHGKGDKPRLVPGHLAAYALHVTASTIVMLVEAHRANP